MNMIQIEKFERILDLECEVRWAKASIIFRPSNVSDWAVSGQEKALKNAKAKLDAAIDALSLDELRAYGPYRLASRKEA
jgi:hypothetical protein